MLHGWTGRIGRRRAFERMQVHAAVYYVLQDLNQWAFSHFCLSLKVLARRTC